MASKDTLGSFGTLLAFIGAILALALIIMGIFNISFDFLPSTSFINISLGIALDYNGIDLLQIIWAVLLLFVTTGKINIGEPLLEGIALLFLGGLLGGIGGVLAIIGGVFVILDALF